jgi:hypothetical protein
VTTAAAVRIERDDTFLGHQAHDPASGCQGVFRFFDVRGPMLQAACTGCDTWIGVPRERAELEARKRASRWDREVEQGGDDADA